jgi:hypothetical protein
MAWYKVLVPLLPLGVITGCGSWGGAAMLITLGGATGALVPPAHLNQFRKTTSPQAEGEARRLGGKLGEGGPSSPWNLSGELLLAHFTPSLLQG